MLLLIDAGNTRVKWALARDDGQAGDWVSSGAVSHAELPQLATHWQGLLPTRALRPGGACSDNTAPPSATLARFVGPRASQSAAHHRFPSQSLLVVTAGTATTVDALDASGRFIGGMILPGLGTMARSLAWNTAQLPDVKEATLDHLFADNTRDAIVSGCIHAQIGAIMQAQGQLPGARCVLSGGAASYIAPHLPLPVERIDNLVLLGLHVALLSETT